MRGIAAGGAEIGRIGAFGQGDALKADRRGGEAERGHRDVGRRGL
ncbi:MAG: hypothetical protein ACJAVS_001037 [Paracoccaceae bacterium]|jgi:hypothetical protein